MVYYKINNDNLILNNKININGYNFSEISKLKGINLIIRINLIGFTLQLSLII